MHVQPTPALAELAQSGQLFKEVFQHGTLSVEVYKPGLTDLQKPHDRDEAYVVIAGQGMFFNDGKQHPFGPGDFLFVKAGKTHYFYDYSADFATWVLFYGPVGGEPEVI